MSKIGKRHAIFIQEMIEQGHTPEGQIRAYRIAYPSCKSDSTARKNSHRLRQNAEIEKLILEGQRARQQLIEEARKEEVLKIAKEKLLSVHEVDAKLCEIISGHHKNKIKRVVFNPQTAKFEIVTIDQEPEAGEITQAIDKYYKRFGSYAAKKIEEVDKLKVIVPGEE